MATFYAHWRDLPATAWRWADFRPREIACRRDGALLLDEEALDRLQALRDRLARPLTLTSAYRSAAHNAAVGGSPTSQHLRGRAFDVALTAGLEREGLRAAAAAVGFTGIGDYDDFLHLDLGPPRRWDRRSRRP